MMAEKQKSYSLKELNLLVKDTLSQYLSQAYWVVGEISEIKEHYSGHCYLELIQKDEESDNIVARARATIWSYSYRMLKPYFESTTGRKLAPGLKVMVLAQVSFHEVYGYSLNITDIEPTFTIGDLELKRRETINRLIADGVFDMNREQTLDLLPNRVAVISSPQAAGYEDFRKQLLGNKNRYRFTIKLFEAVMQGEDAEASIIQTLSNIYNEIDRFDLVAIVRGGGASADLSCFDSYAIASHIAQFPLPVITGIGHEKDTTVSDLVAYKAVKTPTALAEYLIDLANEAEQHYQTLVDSLVGLSTSYIESSKSQLIFFADQLKSASLLTVSHHKNRLTRTWSSLPVLAKFYTYKNLSKVNDLKEQVKSVAQNYINTPRIAIEKFQKELKKYTLQSLTANKQKVDFLGRLIETMSPKNTLKKGFTITMIDGKCVKSVSEINDGVMITTKFWDGEIKSRVE
ncbi:MAG TPA: exodeoxyribonuclease VII large subunit [Bacteroidales bacterium]|nr:exodeoxyribonuclease VII large subunit [Bacteroidales bacterium]